MKLMRAGGASHGLESLVWEHRPHINLVRIASPLHADVDSRKRQVQDQFPKRLTEAEVIDVGGNSSGGRYRSLSSCPTRSTKSGHA